MAGAVQHLDRLRAERGVDVDADDLPGRSDALGELAHRLARPAAGVQAAGAPVRARRGRAAVRWPPPRREPAPAGARTPPACAPARSRPAPSRWSSRPLREVVVIVAMLGAPAAVRIVDATTIFAATGGRGPAPGVRSADARRAARSRRRARGPRRSARAGASRERPRDRGRGRRRASASRACSPRRAAAPRRRARPCCGRAPVRSSRTRPGASPASCSRRLQRRAAVERADRRRRRTRAARARSRGARARARAATRCTPPPTGWCGWPPTSPSGRRPCSSSTTSTGPTRRRCAGWRSSPADSTSCGSACSARCAPASRRRTRTCSPSCSPPRPERPLRPRALGPAAAEALVRERLPAADRELRARLPRRDRRQPVPARRAARPAGVRARRAHATRPPPA